MDAISQESISRYFDLLESTLKKHQLEDCSGQIYNMDETGMPLDPRPPNIIEKGKLQAVRQKEQITVIGCGNAIGQSISPMVIFEGKYQWWSIWNYLWYEWAGPRAFSFLAKTLSNPGGPLLLLLDGYSSHFELGTIELAREKDVVIYAFHRINITATYYACTIT